MSRGSTFVILKRTDKVVSEEEILEKYNSNYALTTKVTSLEELPRCYAYYDEEHHVDTEKRTLMLDILEASFCSTFTCLKEEFNLNPYSNSHDRMIFNKTAASYMLQAIKYLYYSDYSYKLEEILNNSYIEIFSEMCTPYMMYKNPEYGCDDMDGDHHLKRLKRLLETYLCICDEDDENEYVLLYYAWG